LTVLLGLIALAVAPVGAPADDLPAVAKTKTALRTKVKLDFSKEGRLEDILDEIKGAATGITFELDSKGGVSKNIQLKCDLKEGTVEEYLDALFGKANLGYIITTSNKAYIGRIKIKQGKERGDVEGEAPKEKDKPASKDKPEPKDDTKPKDKPVVGKDKVEPKDDTKPKDKTEPKDKAKPKDDSEPKDKTDPKPPEGDDEKAANIKLRSAKGLAQDGKLERAKTLCNEIIKKWPSTKAAEEAKELLKKLDR
jgi:hypothetical protein